LFTQLGTAGAVAAVLFAWVMADKKWHQRELDSVKEQHDRERATLDREIEIRDRRIDRLEQQNAQLADRMLRQAEEGVPVIKAGAEVFARVAHLIERQAP
jgi:hypothetical protein